MQINPELLDRIIVFLREPIDNPEILPNVLPLVLGLVIMELYFGKHKKESLGWNTAVGNSILWISTGISLYMTSTLGQVQLYMVYGLIGIGILVAYMDFFHKWPSTVAFFISSSALIYSVAYMLVIVVKTGLPMKTLTYQAAAIFLIGVNLVFTFIQGLEKDADTFDPDLQQL